jgi:hypothetical protein
MKTSEVIGKFGSQAAAARAARVSAPSLSAWPEHPPAARQVALEVVTGGELRAEQGCLGKVLGLDDMSDASIVESLCRSVLGAEPVTREKADG